MGKEQCICLLTAHDVKPTANRIVIAEALAAADCPMSMKELEYSILSIDKSNIFRTLMLFKAHHLVHVIEDGNGSVKYELCLMAIKRMKTSIYTSFVSSVIRPLACMISLFRTSLCLRIMNSVASTVW